MKGRYAVFRGEKYYPYGGWDDLFGRYETEGEAREAIPKRLRDQWAQVVDLQTGKVLLDR